MAAAVGTTSAAAIGATTVPATDAIVDRAIAHEGRVVADRDGTTTAAERAARGRAGGASRAARGLLAVVLACGGLPSPAGAGSDPLPGMEAARPDDETLVVKVSRAGFEPASLRLRRGETYRLLLGSDDVEHCFGVAELRVEKRVMPDTETELMLTPERAGRFRIYCCVESGEAAEREVGELVVAD